MAVADIGGRGRGALGTCRIAIHLGIGIGRFLADRGALHVHIRA